VSRAEGSAFALAIRSFQGLLRGTPATIESRTEEGRRIVGRADLVLFAATARDRGSLRLLDSERFDPELDLRDDRDGPFRNLRLTCAGAIAALPEGARFSGPVHAVGLTTAGEPDPAALEVDAHGLDIDWNAATRELQTVRASGSPSVLVDGVFVTGDRATVDVPAHTLDVISGPDRLASVEFDTWLWTGSMFRVDYRNRRVQAWQPDLRDDAERGVVSDARDRDLRE
jgi:hypothetical protein